MSEPYVGEIRTTAISYPPKNWAFCLGQTLYIDQNETLFSLIGKSYGGDGIVNFKLPDLRGRIPLSMGLGPGLTPRIAGEIGGSNSVTLTPLTIPQHTHTVTVSKTPAQNFKPEYNRPGSSDQVRLYNPPEEGEAALFSRQALAVSGGDAKQATVPHDNRMPSLCVNFIIALKGVFPVRT